jgi:hypothetical protein
MKDSEKLILPPLMLTATIQVRTDIRATPRRDIDIRLNDYKTSLERWLGNPVVTSVVFVENSGFDLSSLEAIARAFPTKQVEFLSFDSPIFNGERGGKSFGEMLCFEHCLANSELLKSAPNFLKATGRYYVPNAQSLMRLLADRPDIDVVCNMFRNLTWGDTRVFGATKAFLQDYLLPRRDLIDELADRGIEPLMARAVHQLMADGGKWSTPPEWLEVQGISGTLGEAYKVNRFTQGLRYKLLQNILAR